MDADAGAGAAGCVAALGVLVGAAIEPEHVDIEQAGAAEATTIATDMLTGLRVLKGVGGEAPALARYRAASRRPGFFSSPTRGDSCR